MVYSNRTRTTKKRQIGEGWQSCMGFGSYCPKYGGDRIWLPLPDGMNGKIMMGLNEGLALEIPEPGCKLPHFVKNDRDELYLILTSRLNKHGHGKGKIRTLKCQEIDTLRVINSVHSSDPGCKWQEIIARVHGGEAFLLSWQLATSNRPEAQIVFVDERMAVHRVELSKVRQYAREHQLVLPFTITGSPNGTNVQLSRSEWAIVPQK